MKIILENVNMKCTTATDGAEVLDMIKSNEFDIIMLDQNMPIMLGTDIAKDIREYENKNNLKKTPIIAVTGDVMQDSIDKIFDSGMDEYLAKPVEKNTLYNILQNCLT